MRHLARLRQQLRGQDSDLLAERGGGGFKRPLALAMPGLELRAQSRQGRATEHRGKSFDFAVYRSDGDGARSRLCAAEQRPNQRSRKQRRVDGKKDSPTALHLRQGRADAAQRPQARHAIGHDGRVLGKVLALAGDGRGKPRIAQYGQRAHDQRLARKGEQSLVAAHAAGCAAGQDKPGGIGPSRGGCGFRLFFSQDRMPVPAGAPRPADCQLIKV